MLTIRVPSRVHMTLIDLGADGYRRNGGIGFFLDSPTSSFTFSKDSSINLGELENNGFRHEEIEKIAGILHAEKARRNCSGIKLECAELPHRHCGLGTGTGMALACIEAFFKLNNISATETEIVEISGRGGASGIGVHGYFTGGFIFDVGRRFDGSPLTSSDNMSRSFKIPTQLVRLSIPKWRIGILRFPAGIELSLTVENLLFAQRLPLTDEEVHKIAYHSIFGACAAVAEGDFFSFCRAINRIQECAWKSAEISLYGDVVTDCMAQLRALGCDAVGMSSVGPTLFFLAHSFSSVYARVIDAFPEMKVSSTLPTNSGRTIAYD